MSALIGMDHPHYIFSPLPHRIPLVWPQGLPLAMTVFLYFEHWHSHPAANAIIEPRFQDPLGRFEPDYRAFSIRQYGLRVGIFRVLDALDASNFKVTVAANAEAIEHYPYLVDHFVRRGYEFAAHGLSSSNLVSSQMTEFQEISYIEKSIASVEKATGRRPDGWIAQDYGESTRTPSLLARAGLKYLADWANDDQPYQMTTTPSLVSIPNQADLDDVQLLWHRRVPSSKYVNILQAAADQLAHEGTQSGRFLGLHIHPWLFGMPHRIKYLEAVLTSLSQRRDIWFATAGDVAAVASKQFKK